MFLFDVVAQRAVGRRVSSAERRSLVKAKLTHCKYSIWCCIIITGEAVDLNQAQNPDSKRNGRPFRFRLQLGPRREFFHQTRRNVLVFFRFNQAASFTFFSFYYFQCFRSSGILGWREKLYLVQNVPTSASMRSGVVRPDVFFVSVVSAPGRWDSFIKEEFNLELLL